MRPTRIRAGLDDVPTRYDIARCDRFLLHIADKAEPAARDRANELLPIAAVADGDTRGIDAAAQG